MVRGKIGSVSSGTLRHGDLLHAFADELRRLDSTGRHRPLIAEAGSVDPDSDDAGEVLSDLEDALGGFAPPYGYFGSHPGDGADFGYWPDWDRIECDRRDGELLSGDELPGRRTASGYFLHISDHGNAELYEWKARRWRSVWGVV